MLETDIPFAFRIDSASRYYEYLSRVENLHWIDILEEVDGNPGFGIPEALVLLHPRFYQEIGAKDPRGERSFPSAKTNSRCRSKDIWGYSCPVAEPNIHIDHMFPHSKGGSTHTLNAMYLCEEHNMSKHTDIHLVPWETLTLTNSWITNSLITLVNAASRTTSKKLYVPEKQLKKF